jgi:Family of unknown function (DUF5677)
MVTDGTQVHAGRRNSKRGSTNRDVGPSTRLDPGPGAKRPWTRLKLGNFLAVSVGSPPLPHGVSRLILSPPPTVAFAHRTVRAQCWLTMSIRSQGFLGDEAESKRTEIRNAYPGPFNRLAELNAISHEYLQSLQLAERTEPHVWAAAFYIRGLTCFQSIVILSERGLVDDVASLCRTLLQVHFRSAAIAQDSTVINRLKASAENLRKQRAEGFESGKFQTPANVAHVDWRTKISEIETIIDQLGRSQTNDWELFKLGNCDPRDYNAYQLFSDAAHVSVIELQKLMKFDASGHFAGFRYGPHDRNLVALALYAAQIMMDILESTDKVMAIGLPASLREFQNRIVSS